MRRSLMIIGVLLFTMCGGTNRIEYPVPSKKNIVIVRVFNDCGEIIYTQELE